MRRKRLLIGCSALAATLLAGAAWADVVCGDAECDWVIISADAITEEPDPLTAWEGYTEDLGQPLNPNGDARGDGPPDFALDPGTGLPVAVWAYSIGSSFEIAYSAWNGSVWQGPQFLTANAANDLEPSITVDSVGRLYVTWWVSDLQTNLVQRSIRDPETGLFGFPETIATNGRRPSAIGYMDRVLVAFERPLAAGGQAVVVQTRRGGMVLREEVLATTRRVNPLNVELNGGSGRIVLKWTHSATQIGYTEYQNGVWGIPLEIWLHSGGTVRDGSNKAVSPGAGY